MLYDLPKLECNIQPHYSTARHRQLASQWFWQNVKPAKITWKWWVKYVCDLLTFRSDSRLVWTIFQYSDGLCQAHSNDPDSQTTANLIILSNRSAFKAQWGHANIKHIHSGAIDNRGCHRLRTQTQQGNWNRLHAHDVGIPLFGLGGHRTMWSTYLLTWQGLKCASPNWHAMLACPHVT